MRKLIVALVTGLLVFGCAVTVEASPRGKAFLHGMKTPAMLAENIEQALIGDPSGRTMISSPYCRENGSCAAPVDYLEMIRDADPDSDMAKTGKVGDLPSYLRSLVMEEAPIGKYWMACLRQSRKSHTGYEPLFHCLARAFKKGEMAWVNSKTHKVVLAADCTNPVGKPEVPVPVGTVSSPCVELHFFTREGDRAVRFKQYGPTDIANDQCTGLKRAGETDFESPFVERCPDVNCNFATPDADLGQSGWETGSFTPIPGEQVLRLPAKVIDQQGGYIIVLCLDHDGQHSCGMDVWWFDYVPTGGTNVATLYYDQATAGDAKDILGRPTWLWWKWIGHDDCYRPEGQR